MFLGTILGIFGILQFFLIFLKIFEDSTFHGKLGKKFSKSLPQNTFKTCLDTFGNTFGHFWKFENFFFENFRKLDAPRNNGQKKKNSKNLTQNKFKTRLDAFGNDFGHFWNFAIFFDFFENFRRLDLPWKTGQKFFSKSLPQNTFKTRLDAFGNDFGHFWNFAIFLDFFENFRRLDLPWKTGQKFFKKFAPKHVQNMFGYFWEHFWAFLEI